MISAFGVDHGEISKMSMNGRKFKALLATKNRGTGRAKQYAQTKYDLFTTGQTKGTHPVGRMESEDKKAQLRALTRTDRTTRDNNRRGI